MTWMSHNFTMIAADQDIFANDRHRFSVLHNTEDDWSLTIQHVQFSDAQRYTCYVNIIPPIFKEVTLIVYGNTASMFAHLMMNIPVTYSKIKQLHI